MDKCLKLENFNEEEVEEIHAIVHDEVQVYNTFLIIFLVTMEPH